MSVHNVLEIHEWPKWHDETCEKCGEFVPAGNAHYCDSEFVPKGKEMSDTKQD